VFDDMRERVWRGLQGRQVQQYIAEKLEEQERPTGSSAVPCTCKSRTSRRDRAGCATFTWPFGSTERGTVWPPSPTSRISVCSLPWRSASVFRRWTSSSASGASCTTSRAGSTTC
jgi:hypothetical protein